MNKKRKISIHDYPSDERFYYQTIVYYVLNGEEKRYEGEIEAATMMHAFAIARAHIRELGGETIEEIRQPIIVQRGPVDPKHPLYEWYKKMENHSPDWLDDI